MKHGATKDRKPLHQWQCFLPLILAAVVVGGALIFVTPVFQTNDDIAHLLFILNGETTIYFSPLLARIISFFYSLSKEVAFYGLFLYAAHFLGLVIFFRALQVLEGSKLFKGVFLLIYLPIYFSFLAGPGYNNASLMPEVNGLFLLMASLSGNNRNKWNYLLAGIGLALGYLFRPQSILLVSAFFLPILIYLFWRSKHLKEIGLFLLPLILIFLLNNLYITYCTSSAYKKYVDFEQIREKYHTYSLESDTAEILEVNNWKENDLKMITAYMYMHEGKFNKNTLKKLLGNSSRFKKDIKQIGWRGLSFLKSFWLYLLMISFVSIFHFLVVKQRKLYLLLFFLYTIGGMFFMFTFYRFPHRIAIPVFILYLLVWLVFISRSEVKVKSSRLLLPALLPAVAIMFWSSAMLIQILGANQVNSRSTYQDLNLLNESYKGKTIIGFLNMEHLNPLSPVNMGFNYIPPGWPIYSPVFYRSLSEGMQIGKSSKMWPSLVDNPNSFLVLSPYELSMIRQFMLDTYGESVEFHQMDNLNNRGVYSMRKNRSSNMIGY